MASIRVELPYHLRNLAHVEETEVTVDVDGDVTQKSVLDAVEANYPMLRGTIREYGTLKRRAFLRYYACGLDLSHEAADTLLPEAVVDGSEPYIVLGSIAGG